jgi:beta-phosphoglucomutase family hydrolase
MATTFILGERRLQGIIFDMDGTMIDNMMVHHRAWQRKLASLGLEMTLEEVRQEIHGVNYEILERLFGDRFSHDDRLRIADEKEAEYRRIFKDELALLPGLPELLDQLKEAGIPLAIGTAAPGVNADFVLDELQLRDYFGAVVFAEMVEKGKPDPEVFERAAAGLGIPVSECLIFEDSPTGAEAARRAGAAAIILTTTHPSHEFGEAPHVAHFLDDFASLVLRESATDWELILT